MKVSYSLEHTDVGEAYIIFYEFTFTTIFMCTGFLLACYTAGYYTKKHEEENLNTDNPHNKYAEGKDK